MHVVRLKRKSYRPRQDTDATAATLARMEEATVIISRPLSTGQLEAVAQRLVSLTEGGAADSKVVQIGTRNPG